MKNTLSAIVLLAWSGCALAQTYSITDLGSFGGTYGAVASSVNDSGQVTGTSYLSGSAIVEHAFLYSNGVMQDIGTLGGQGSEGAGINDSGQVVGNSALSSGVQHAFLYSNGVMNDLGTLGGTGSSAGGINDAGQVTGTAELSGPQVYDAFVYSSGVMNDLGAAPGVSGSDGWAINASGQVVGTGSLISTGANNAFLYSDGVWQSLGTLGGANSDAEGINTSGEIVGFSDTIGNYYHAFLYSGGVMQDLGTLPGYNSSASQGINDLDQIVGYSYVTGSSLPNDYRASLEFGGTTFDLNSMIDQASPLKPYVTLHYAVGISSNGKYIVANGTDSRISLPPGTDSNRAYLLTLETNAPSVTPVVTGKLGTNGWYTSATTTVAWTVTGFPIPTTSGCGTVSVPQTTGTSYSCSATNSSGTASNSVIIKEDSVKPQVTIKVPVKGKTYALHAKVLASYSCLDATSGVASCTGTVKDGAPINTSTAGTKTFKVVGKDKAGNKKAVSLLYNVQ